MPGHFSSMSQQAGRFERSMQCTLAALPRPRGDTHRTALRRIDNLQDLDMSAPILQRAAAGHRQPTLQFPRNVFGVTLLLCMAQQANASLIGEGMGGVPAARGPAPPEADPARWPTPMDVVDGHAHQRALVGGGGWPPGAAAADTRIPLQALPGSEATAAADRLLHDEAGTDVPPAPTALAFAAGACIRNKRLCAAAIAGAGVYAAADLLGTLYRPELQRHWQAVQAALAPAPAALSRFTLDLDALPPQARWNASGRDPARPPCTSLGNHINGLWQDTGALERSRTQQGTFVDLRDRSLAIRQQLARQVATLPDPSPAEKLVSDLWSAGMDEGRVDVLGITPLRPALDAIEALDTTAALSTFLFAQTARGRNALFQLNALPDMEHPDRLMAYLSQGGLGLPDADWYTHPQMAPRVDAYRSYIVRMLSLSGLPAVDAAQAAGEVVALEKVLAAASVPFSRLANDITPYYNPQPVAEASAQTPRLQWEALFEQHGVDAPEQLSLGMPDYFRCLDTLLDTLPLQTWKHYLRFHALDDAAPCLAQRFAMAHADFHDGVLKGRRSPVPRWARVLELIDQNAGLAMSEPYIAAIWSAQTGQQVQALSSDIHAALKRRLAGAAWMAPDTRGRALAKAERIHVDTGHPATWPEWEGAGTEGRDFLHDVHAVQAFVHRRNIARIGLQVDPNEWKLSAQSVDAYQDTFQNRIVIPVAILQPPFFDPAADDALNYGGIGVVLGHEMAHGFDSIGSHIDADGASRDWWAAEDRQRFDAMAARLAAQVSSYQVDGREVDGDLTLDENLADLGGLAIALDALREKTRDVPDPMVDGMTREQRFFANFAFCWRRAATAERTALDMDMENHAPSQVRADLGPSNLPAFSEAFDCAPGDPMARNQTERVQFL